MPSSLPLLLFRSGRTDGSCGLLWDSGDKPIKDDIHLRRLHPSPENHCRQCAHTRGCWQVFVFVSTSPTRTLPLASVHPKEALPTAKGHGPREDFINKVHRKRVPSCAGRAVTHIPTSFGTGENHRSQARNDLLAQSSLKAVRSELSASTPLRAKALDIFCAWIKRRPLFS